jgi:hypothetical protein
MSTFSSNPTNSITSVGTASSLDAKDSPKFASTVSKSRVSISNTLANSTKVVPSAISAAPPARGLSSDRASLAFSPAASFLFARTVPFPATLNFLYLEIFSFVFFDRFPSPSSSSSSAVSFFPLYPTRGFSLAVALVAPVPSRPFAIVIIDDVPNDLRARDDGRSPSARDVVVVRARAAASAPIPRAFAECGASRASERARARSSTLGVIVDSARVAARALVDARDAARRIIVDGARDTPRR